MSPQNNPKFTQDQIIDYVSKKVEATWDRVYVSAQKVLGSIKKNGYDYNQVNQSVNPSVSVVLENLSELVKTIDLVCGAIGIVDIETVVARDVERKLVNSKQVVVFMESVMLAMQAGDEDECNRLYEMLVKQAPF